MRTYVAFVRAVMIGREGVHRSVLLAMFERAGATGTRSYISTGNVSFVVEPDRLDQLVTAVEADLERLLQRPTPVRALCVTDLVVDDQIGDTKPTWC